MSRLALDLALPALVAARRIGSGGEDRASSLHRRHPHAARGGRARAGGGDPCGVIALVPGTAGSAPVIALVLGDHRWRWFRPRAMCVRARCRPSTTSAPIRTSRATRSAAPTPTSIPCACRCAQHRVRAREGRDRGSRLADRARGSIRRPHRGGRDDLLVRIQGRRGGADCCGRRGKPGRRALEIARRKGRSGN